MVNLLSFPELVLQEATLPRRLLHPLALRQNSSALMAACDGL